MSNQKTHGFLNVLIILCITLKTNGFYVGITYVKNAIAKGAVCLDGSPPAYHMDKGFGAGVNNWLVHIEGGGWCNNATTCLTRKNTRLGSSKQMIKQVAFSGLLHNKEKFNPDFYNWNRIKVRYCDGSSFTGDVKAVDPATNLHYRGGRVWHAVIEDLLAKGMKNARNALLSGCSAGGLTSILHCDNFRGLLPRRTKVKCLADAGYFINARDLSGAMHIQEFYADVVKTHIMSSDNLKFSLRSIIEKNKLNGTNFLDWERNLRIVLKSEGLLNVLEAPIPTVTETSSDEEQEIATLFETASLQVTCLMLAAMEPELQKRFEHSDAYSIITELKTLFQNQARIERYETHKAILDSKLEKGKPVSPHVIRLTGLFKRMENLGTPYDQELATDIVLRSLHDGFAPFRMQYHMNGLEHDLIELHGMLKNAEGNITDDKRKEVLNVNKGKGFKKGAKGKSNYQGKGKKVAKPKGDEKPKVAADHDCFYCKAKGHWKRNCPKYLEDKKNGTVSSTSGTKK